MNVQQIVKKNTDWVNLYRRIYRKCLKTSFFFFFFIYLLFYFFLFYLFIYLFIYFFLRRKSGSVTVTSPGSLTKVYSGGFVLYTGKQLII